MSTENLKSLLGANLKRLRADRSQAQMAGLLGVQQADYWRWESGQMLPRSDRLARIAQTLGVTATELLSPPGSGDMRVAQAYLNTLTFPSKADEEDAKALAESCGMTVPEFAIECIKRRGVETAREIQARRQEIGAMRETPPPELKPVKGGGVVVEPPEAKAAASKMLRKGAKSQ